MSSGNYLRGAIAFVGIMGAGYGLMKYTTPTEEEFYNNLAPDLKKQVDAHRQATSRKAAYLEQLERAKQSEDANAPIWAEQAARKAKDSSPPQ